MKSNYKEGIIYNGNIMKIENGKSILLKEKEKIIYNSEEDTFFPFQSLTSLLYYGSLIDGDKLNDRQIKEYREKFIQGNYPYGDTALEGECYIDINTIVKDNIEEYANKRGR